MMLTALSQCSCVTVTVITPLSTCIPDPAQGPGFWDGTRLLRTIVMACDTALASIQLFPPERTSTT